MYLIIYKENRLFSYLNGTESFLRSNFAAFRPLRPWLLEQMGIGV